MASVEVSPRNAFDPRWGGPNPASCDDLTWWELTDACGGCASEDCHEGPCGQMPVTDPMYGHLRMLCDKCQMRQAEGWWA